VRGKEVTVTEKIVRYAEDYKSGEVFDLGSYDVTRDEILEFSKRYDPFPFHVDDEAAQATAFGGIISSGWLTALVWLRLMHRAFLCHETTLGSPGHEEMNWPKPVRPGDRLQGRVEITGSRTSKSKPELGFVRYTSTLSNQHGEQVFVTTSTLIVKSRSASR
jgi:acyl dehydratase